MLNLLHLFPIDNHFLLLFLHADLTLEVLISLFFDFSEFQIHFKFLGVLIEHFHQICSFYLIFDGIFHEITMGTLNQKFGIFHKTIKISFSPWKVSIHHTFGIS